MTPAMVEQVGPSFHGWMPYDFLEKIKIERFTIIQSLFAIFRLLRSFRLHGLC